jgi:hypothetical protein
MTDATEHALQEKAQAFIASLSNEQRAQFVELLKPVSGDSDEVQGYGPPKT